MDEGLFLFGFLDFGFSGFYYACEKTEEALVVLIKGMELCIV